MFQITEEEFKKALQETNNTGDNNTVNMKKIDGQWHICRDGWVFQPATEREIVTHLFNGLSLEKFKECFK